MSIKEGDMVSIRQDFIDEYHKHEGNYIPAYTTPYQQP